MIVRCYFFDRKWRCCADDARVDSLERPRTVPDGEATTSGIVGGPQGPNPAGELAKTVLGPLLCVSGLLMALVGIVDEDISLEFMGAIVGSSATCSAGGFSASPPWRSPRCC